MTLTTHGIVGGAIVSLLPTHPALGICLAFASHFLLDGIPHWDYPIQSDSVRPDSRARMQYDSALLADALTIGCDGMLGIGLAIILFGVAWDTNDLFFVACGASAGILPDALQFVYARFPREPLTSLQRFHEWIHTTKRMKKQPILGVISQLAFLALFLIVIRSIATLM